MFFAGLEIDIAQFRRERNKSFIFGLVTTVIPFLLGTAVGFLFGYQPVSAIVLGSLLASHTLLAAPIMFGWVKLGSSPSPSFGATVISDTLSPDRVCHLRSDLSERLFSFRTRCAAH